MSILGSAPAIHAGHSQQMNKTAQKSERMILEFNKTGLQYLTNEKTFSEAFDYFKKAQKTVLDELQITPEHKRINQLAAITYNNIACYYKKTNKPKVALTYLKKALEIQVFKVQNWLSTASTHLNICAIYSFIKKHQEACQHAILALKMLEKWSNQEQSKKQPEEQMKTFANVKMLANYNSAIENEYLKKFQEALQFYETTKQLASANEAKNAILIKTCQEGIQRMKQEQKLNKQRLIEIITKRKQHQQKNNSEWMRKNKKNFPKDGEGWRDLIRNRKYAQYKIQTQHLSTQAKKHQSVGKLTSIRPVLHTQEPHQNSQFNLPKKVD